MHDIIANKRGRKETLLEFRSQDATKVCDQMNNSFIVIIHGAEGDNMGNNAIDYHTRLVRVEISVIYRKK
jgi:hypothetical protein